jgi:hypothetical protein
LRALALACVLLLANSATAQDQRVGEIEVGGQRFELILRPVNQPPPPPPVTRSIWGAQVAGTGEWVRSAPAGTVVRIVGEGFGSEPGQALVSGKPADVLLWEPLSVTVKLPPTPRVEVGGLLLKTTAWEIGSPFAFALEPARDLPPPPPPPGGQEPTTTVVTGTLGAPVRLFGTGFGNSTGRVWQDGAPVEVVQWSDTLIVVTSRVRDERGSLWTVQRPDGKFYQSGGVAVVPR